MATHTNTRTSAAAQPVIRPFAELVEAYMVETRAIESGRLVDFKVVREVIEARNAAVRLYVDGHDQQAREAMEELLKGLQIRQVSYIKNAVRVGDPEHQNSKYRMDGRFIRDLALMREEGYDQDLFNRARKRVDALVAMVKSWSTSTPDLTAAAILFNEVAEVMAEVDAEQDKRDEKRERRERERLAAEAQAEQDKRLEQERLEQERRQAEIRKDRAAKMAELFPDLASELAA